MPTEAKNLPARTLIRSGTPPRTRLYAPLYFKQCVVLLVAFLLPGITCAGYLGAFPSIEQFLPTGVVKIFGYSANAEYLTIGFSFLFGFLIALLFAGMLFIDRAKSVIAFILKIRSASYEHVPLLPYLGHDEIGEIGRQVAYSSVHFSKVGEESKQATEQRSLFIMTAAHQLRTPLTGLIWTIEQLRKGEMPQEEREMLLSAVDSSVRRMRLVIEHILASANVEEGRFGYVFEETDLVPVIENLIAEFKPLSEKRKVSVRLVHENTRKVFADAERISLVLFDLTSNAIDYTPEGGAVTVWLKGVGKDLEVAVADTGIGISADELPLLFNKFYRSDRARHMRPDGSGLGLYLARTIVERHGGDLKIESTEGKGTRVSFLLHSERGRIPH